MAETIALGSDHAGVTLKAYLIDILKKNGYETKDLGTHDTASVDYPDFADRVAQAVKGKECRWGILICGTGIGMAIRANRYRGVRAANCSTLFTVDLARRHNDANVLTMGARIVAPQLAETLMMRFLATPFEGGRHQRRVDKMDAPVHT